MPAQTVWAGEARIKGSSEFVRMALLTAALFGLQLVWGLEMTCMLAPSGRGSSAADSIV